MEARVRAAELAGLAALAVLAELMDQHVYMSARQRTAERTASLEEWLIGEYLANLDRNLNRILVNGTHIWACRPLTNAARLLIVSSWKAGVLVRRCGLVAALTKVAAIL